MEAGNWVSKNTNTVFGIDVPPFVRFVVKHNAGTEDTRTVRGKEQIPRRWCSSE